MTSGPGWVPGCAPNFAQAQSVPLGVQFGVRILRPRAEMDGSNAGSDFEIQLWIRFLRIIWCKHNRQQLSGSTIGSGIGSLGFGLICRLLAACAKHGNCWSTTYQISNIPPWTPTWGTHPDVFLDPGIIILVGEKLSTNGTGPFIRPKAEKPRSVGISTFTASQTRGWTQMCPVLYECIWQPRTRKLLHMFRVPCLSHGHNAQSNPQPGCKEMASQFILDI